MTPLEHNLIERLRSVEEIVTALESALGKGDFEAGAELATGLVAGSTKMLEELDHDRKLGPENVGELIACLRVDRNAAFAFRKLAGVSGESDPAMGTVCATMLQQGHDHLQAFLGRSPVERSTNADVDEQ